MNKGRFNKILLFTTLCLGLFIGAKNADADSIRVDVTATYVPGFTRYCFQVINDDQNEPEPKYHVEQQIVWTFDGYFGAGSKTKFTVDKPDNTIKPGQRSSVFSFVINGEITVTEFETGYQESPGNYRTICKTTNPFGEGVFLTNDNDTDFLRDKDGDGIADIFDDNPDSTN